jgi:ribosomal protein S18 acetylase RimI-like enzyme
MWSIMTRPAAARLAIARLAIARLAIARGERHPGEMISIRPGRPQDEAALRDIDIATWAADVSPAPPPGADRTFFSERKPPDDVLVAETGGAVIGFAFVHQPMAVPSHAHVLEIGGLAVSPAHQRSGAGRRLVEASIERARGQGARKLTLRVLGPNARARALYESCGFVIEGIQVAEFLLDGRYVDDVLMACHLAE